MVCDYGMSDNLGPLTFGKREEQIFLGREISQHRDYSELTAQRIDQEVRDIVTGCYDKTSKLIKERIDTLHMMAKALLERETLDVAMIDDIMNGTYEPPKAPETAAA
jgi:cell division protease FtsH